MKCERARPDPVEAKPHFFTGLALLALLVLSLTLLSAERFGPFTYEVDGDEITITDY